MGTTWREVERERRDAEQSGSRVFWIVVVAGLAFLAGRYWSRTDEPPATDASPPEIVAPQPLSGSREIQLPRRDVLPDPVPQSAGSAPVPAGGRTVGVYQCILNGELVLSDRPCGVQSRARDIVIDDPDEREAAEARQRTWAAQGSRPVAPQTSLGSGSLNRQPSATNVAAAPTVDNSWQCNQIERQIEALNSRMRQGYSSTEGEWLRAQWHDLKARRQALKCGR